MVLRVEPKKAGDTAYSWLCRCECGTEKLVKGQSLKNGDTTSCGCHGKDWCRKHGMEGTSIYNLWVAMRHRCQNPKFAGYSNYGGRGIKVCDRWQVFAAFYADMGDKPAGKTLDRKDVNGNYEPTNCRWATATEQAHNKRNTIMVGGRPLAEIAREIGMSPRKLAGRYRAGYRGDDLVAPALNGKNARRPAVAN